MGRWPSARLVAALVLATIGWTTMAGATAHARVQEQSPLASLIPPDSQAWQTRREDRIQLIRSKLAKPEALNPAFDEMIAQFEANPMNQTPLENLDLIGAYYAPRDGILKVLPQIVMNVTLGWYDALRFASPSGQDQILNGEGFFKRALLLAGKPRIDEYVALIRDHPDQVRAAVDQGLAMAETLKDTVSYDRNWPSAYGFDRTVCNLGGDCPKPPGALPALWPDLWAQARDQVGVYFRGK